MELGDSDSDDDAIYDESNDNYFDTSNGNSLGYPIESTDTEIDDFHDEFYELLYPILPYEPVTSLPPLTQGT